MERVRSLRSIRRAATVAFTSTASNLVTSAPLDGMTRQVFWRLVSVRSSTVGTQLVSMAADGVSAGNGDSFNPVISPDARYRGFRVARDESRVQRDIRRSHSAGIRARHLHRRREHHLFADDVSGVDAGRNDARKWAELGALDLQRCIYVAFVSSAKSGRDGAEPEWVGGSVRARVRDATDNLHGRNGSRIDARRSDPGERREHANGDSGQTGAILRSHRRERISASIRAECRKSTSGTRV